MAYIKYTEEILTDAVNSSKSVSGVIRYLGLKQSGGTHNHISRRIKHYNIDTSHFTGRAHNRGMPATTRKTADEVLILNTKHNRRESVVRLRRSLLEIGVPHKCLFCKNTGEWQGKPMILEIDHIDGNWLDNRRENLRFLCPNCHSQTSTNSSWKNTEKVNKPSKPRKPSKSRKRKKPNTCECGESVSRQATMCVPCSRKNSEKISWPEDSELLEMVSNSNYSAVGRQLGVSDNAVRKRVRKISP